MKFTCYWWRFDNVPPSDEPHVIIACTLHATQLFKYGWQPGAADLWRQLSKDRDLRHRCVVCKGFDVAAGTASDRLTLGERA